MVHTKTSVFSLSVVSSIEGYEALEEEIRQLDEEAAEKRKILKARKKQVETKKESKTKTCEPHEPRYMPKQRSLVQVSTCDSPA